MTGVPAGRVTQGEEELLDPDWQYLQEHGLNLTTLELHFPLGADFKDMNGWAARGAADSLEGDSRTCVGQSVVNAAVRAARFGVPRPVTRS
jgi:hypothetical protein